MALIHDDPARFGLDDNNLRPPAAEFQIADSILELAQTLHEYIKENPEAEPVLRETYAALVRAVDRYWGDWGLGPVEAKPNPTEAKPKKFGIPFSRKVGR